MSIEIKTVNLYPVRRDKQIPLSQSIGVSSGGVGSGGVGSSIDPSTYRWDSDTSTLYVYGNVQAYGEVTAFSATSAPLRWWDSMPTASGSVLGGIKLGNGLYWVNGKVDVSVNTGGIGDVTKVYVDGSLGTRDTAISGKQPQLNGTGFVKASGTSISYDNNTYLTGITSGQVTGALGFTPYNATNPNGYITSSALSPYAPLANPIFSDGIGVSNGLWNVRKIVLNGLGGNTGCLKWYIRMHPDALGTMASLKVTIHDSYNYCPTGGFLTGEFTYRNTGSGFLNEPDFRITSTTGNAWYYCRLGAVEIENGYVSIPVWCYNNNNLQALVEWYDTSDVIRGNMSVTTAVQSTLPDFNYQSIKSDLYVEGNTYLGSSSGTRVQINSGGYIQVASANANDNLVIRPKGAGGAVMMCYGDGGGTIFYNGGTTEVARIDTNGYARFNSNIILGDNGIQQTATPNFINLGETFSDGTSSSKLKIILHSGGYGFSVGSVADVQYHSTTFHDSYINNTLTTRIKSGEFSVAGNIVASGEVTAYYSSDERLKSNIKPFKALDIIHQLKPVTFNWNDKAKEFNSSKDDRNNFGLIAQEVEQVIPEVVHPIYDEYKSVDYVQMVPILIQAIKELHTEITVLKSQINSKIIECNGFRDNQYINNFS